MVNTLMKKDIEEQIAMNDIKELQSLIASSGKTMDEVREFLNSSSDAGKEKESKGRSKK